MLSFFRKAKAPETLKERVAAFWSWYEANAQRFFDTIEAKRCADLQPEVSDAVDRWLRDLAWEFGPGENNQGHSFTLSGEGVLAKQFAAEYSLTQAPQIKGWTFYASRQPSDEVKGSLLRLEEKYDFSPGELWIHAVPNEQSEMLDITASHPLFSNLAEKSRWTALFLLLDDVLGEHGTQNWIGEIRFADDRLKDSVPLWELRDIIQLTARDKDWKKYKPTETYSLYRRQEPGSGFPRADIFSGVTRFFKLVTGYLNEGGPVEHPVPEAGIDFLYVAFDAAILPKGEEVAYRGEIEDAIIAVLGKHASGHGLGGATGRERAYIDLMIYDGTASVELIKEVLRKRAIPGGAELRYFTKDKAAETIRI